MAAKTNKKSAGLLMYRIIGKRLEVFLIHMGGPYFAGKDAGAWSIPKGEYDHDEDPFDAAKREFLEETGFRAEGSFVRLSDIRQPGGKLVSVWSFAGDCDPKNIVSNTFSIEWPPRSGKMREFPEADRGDWFTLSTAKQKIVKGQIPFLDELAEKLGFKEGL